MGPTDVILWCLAALAVAVTAAFVLGTALMLLSMTVQAFRRENSGSVEPPRATVPGLRRRRREWSAPASGGARRRIHPSDRRPRG
jgi:hypothetical protein